MRSPRIGAQTVWRRKRSPRDPQPHHQQGARHRSTGELERPHALPRLQTSHITVVWVIALTLLPHLYFRFATSPPGRGSQERDEELALAQTFFGQETLRHVTSDPSPAYIVR